MPEFPHPAAIILAAGGSRRMGQPKALLGFQGGTFLGHLIRVFRQAGCQPVMAVISPESELTGKDIHDVEVVQNPQPENGPISSVKLALSILSPHCPGYFLHPVDHPALSAETLLALLQIWDGNPIKAVKPVYEGRGGHPLLLGRGWTDRILQLPLKSNLRDLLHADPDNVFTQAVADPGVLLNVNDPADYARLLDLYPDG